MQFLIEDLSCNHCAGVITKTVTTLDPTAMLDIDIPSKTVKIRSTANAQTIAAALDQAGYPAVFQSE